MSAAVATNTVTIVPAGPGGSSSGGAVAGTVAVLPPTLAVEDAPLPSSSGPITTLPIAFRRRMETLKHNSECENDEQRHNQTLPSFVDAKIAASDSGVFLSMQDIDRELPSGGGGGGREDGASGSNRLLLVSSSGRSIASSSGTRSKEPTPRLKKSHKQRLQPTGAGAGAGQPGRSNSESDTKELGDDEDDEDDDNEELDDEEERQQRIRAVKKTTGAASASATTTDDNNGPDNDAEEEDDEEEEVGLTMRLKKKKKHELRLMNRTCQSLPDVNSPRPKALLKVVTACDSTDTDGFGEDQQQDDQSFTDNTTTTTTTSQQEQQQQQQDKTGKVLVTTVTAEPAKSGGEKKVVARSTDPSAVVRPCDTGGGVEMVDAVGPAAAAAPVAPGATITTDQNMLQVFAIDPKLINKYDGLEQTLYYIDENGSPKIREKYALQRQLAEEKRQRKQQKKLERQAAKSSGGGEPTVQCSCFSFSRLSRKFKEMCKCFVPISQFSQIRFVTRCVFWRVW
uniref:Uncharacterized protein n=1 Tax=Anopheles albimanus TaxID=7167 RepID=A0A182F9J4_ANOAL